jgi:hypothetical protein
MENLNGKIMKARRRITIIGSSIAVHERTNPEREFMSLIFILVFGE